MQTEVDKYWGVMTVKTEYFKSKHEAEEHKIWRLNQYPFCSEFIALEELHKDEVVLDYGCGPGNDLIHFMNSKAKKIIGIDISDKALSYAKHYTSLYLDNDIPIEFIKTTDGSKVISLEDESIDYILCSGVLHHVSNPTTIIKEFFRILKNKSIVRIMVYNRNSIFFHVYVAYILGGGIIGNNVDETFRKSTDGVNCPISKAYTPNELIKVCDDVGFTTEFVGGYFSRYDSIDFLNKHKYELLISPDINNEHKEFVHMIKIDEKGNPTYNNKYCGIGGVYKLYKE